MNTTDLGQNAIIKVKNLRLRTFIGFNPEERQKQQDVVINLEIHYPFSASLLEDNVDAALNYKDVTKRVIALVEDGHFLLLEKLVAEVLAVCCSHPSVTFASVTIDKPHALRFADSVSLTLNYASEPAPEQALVHKADSKKVFAANG